jgi:hypothetical protein
MLPGMLTVPLWSFLYKLGTRYRVSWSHGRDVYELYFELGPDFYRRPKHIGQNACRTYVINAFAADAPGQSVISKITWVVGACCLHEYVVSLISLIQ